MLGGRIRYGLPVVLYHWIAGLIGLLLFLACVFDPPFPQLTPPAAAFLIFLSMHVAASFLHFQYARLSVVITFESTFTVAALLVFGSLPAVWLSLLGIIIGSVKRVAQRRIRTKKQTPLNYDVSIIVLNTGMVAMMWLAASWLYFRLLRGQFPLETLTLEIIMSVLIMYAGTSVINHLVLLVSSYLQGQDSFEFLRRAMIPAFFTELAAVPFGVVMALAYTRLGIVAFCFLGATLLLSNGVLRRIGQIKYDLEDKLRQLTALQRISSQVISLREQKELGTLLSGELGNIIEEARWYLATASDEGTLEFFSGNLPPESGLHRLAQKALQTKQLVLIHDTRKNGPEWIRFDLEDEQVHSCVIVPMLSGENICGLLIGSSTEASTFKDEDLKALTMVADEAALAIENAHLYSTLTDKVSELERLNLDLRQLDHMKSEFLANVSHELRTPLTSIKGYVEYIRKEKLGPVTPLQQEGLTVANRNILRLQRLINDLLDYTRLEFKKTPLNLSPCSLRHIWNEVYEQYAETIEKKRLTVHSAIRRDLPLLFVDREKFEQALSNLLSNAVKFTPDGGSVYLDTQLIRHHPRYFHTEIYSGQCPADLLVPVQISISDTGIGIAEESIPRIFERFYQVDSSNTRKYGGTGLGLALVKSIIDAHGCAIDVTSKPGAGTTFSMVIPGIQAADVPSSMKSHLIEQVPTPKYLT